MPQVHNNLLILKLSFYLLIMSIDSVSLKYNNSQKSLKQIIVFHIYIKQIQEKCPFCIDEPNEKACNYK